MVKFYADKIRSGVINQNTGAEWTLEGIPKIWRVKVEKELKE